MKFYDQWDNRPKVTLEHNDGISEVETAGYVTAEQKVRSMMEAGARLLKSRAYDNASNESDDDLPLDPTRKPGYDMADAYQTLENIKGNLKNSPALVKKEAQPSSTPKKDETSPEDVKKEADKPSSSNKTP
nr:MAG: hypothetical protein [Microvirus sp.]